MTNEQIIFNARCELMESGKIGTTGRTLHLKNDDGSVLMIPEPEEIHTYSYWEKERGLRVKHGEHAICTLQIWKQGKKKKKETDIKNDTEDTENNDVMFMTKGFFFAESQVEKVP